MDQKINPLNLPSALSTHFATILVMSILFSIQCAQIMPGVSYLTTGLTETIQPAHNSPFNAPFGASMVIVWAVLLFVLHASFRRRVFGSAIEISVGHPLAKRIHDLAQEMDVSIARILIDNNRSNVDSLAFGHTRRRTLLLGRGLFKVAGCAPVQFRGRIAHELGHFKNSDIRSTFFCRGLWLGCAVIAILVVVSLALSPLRQIYGSYISSGSLRGFLRMGTYHLQGWYNIFGGSLLFYGPRLIFWTFFLLMEFLALLRSSSPLTTSSVISSF